MEAQGYVYFPTSSIVSLLYVLEDGSSTEIVVTGCETIFPAALYAGVDHADDADRGLQPLPLKPPGSCKPAA